MCAICAEEFAPKWEASAQQFCSTDCQQEGRRRGLVTITPWTDDELGYLLDLSHLSARQAGEELGRSAQSVQHKRRQLRDGWVPEKPPTTEDERDLVRSTPHMTASQVADSLGVSKWRVQRIRAELHSAEGVTFGCSDRKSPHEVGKRTLLAKTCLGCGLLLDRSWYSHSSDGKGGLKSWRARCNRCAGTTAKEKSERPSTSQRDGGKSARESRARLQAFTLERASRHKMPWVEADHLVLRDPDLTHFEKALRLGRTYSATIAAVSANGYTSRVGKGDPMKGRWVIDNPNEPKGCAA